MRRLDEPEGDEPRPQRGRFLLRLGIGALLGAAAFLAIGEWVGATGST